jgi:hypothetical protein
MKIRALAGFAAIIALASCVQVQKRGRSPLKAQYDVANRATIWNSAVVVLQEQNYPIQVLDQASGTITTGEVSGFSASCNDGTSECEAKETVSMTVSPTGTLIVNVNRQVFYNGLGIVPSRWAGIEFSHDVDAVEARQKELTDLILARAKESGAASAAAPASVPAAPASAAPAPPSEAPAPASETTPAAAQ